jgi:DNA-binding NarL/FixJ family response regulator
VIGTATSAREALDLLRRITPSLVITDLVMPDVSGLEFAQQVKRQWPELGVIIMTMMDTPYHRKAALSAGADAFVAKASMDADLVPTIRSVLCDKAPRNGNTL